MDAAEDDKDDQLQRQSADLLADLEKSLRPFLWRKMRGDVCDGIRRRVTVRDTDRLVALLEPFQEQPQLLDPHLKSLVPILAGAFLASLHAATLLTLTSREPITHAKLLMPVSRAICKILYTFCKIRGEKVIVRFFSTETRYLELLLSAIESGSTSQDEERLTTNEEDLEGASAQSDGNAWQWEERYITLLWLSQLLLAPFDLATISSEESRSILAPVISNLHWPPNVPALTLRVVPLAIRYFSSSGKESASAKVLLVRIAMRRDMQDLGIFQALIQWALDSLKQFSPTTSHSSIFHYISTLSFVGGLLVSSVGTTNMKPYLMRITEIVETIFAADDTASYSHNIRQSPVARKAMVKILRQASVLALQDPDEAATDEIVQNSVGILLEMLADTATNVRLAVSKAVSIIAAKLDSEQASEVVDAVLAGLEKNAFSLANAVNEVKDLSRVDQNEWHGLIMTIAHLLYRQTIPAKDLPRIIEALRCGLTFEQRSSNGVSIGINVRDAANFGIWSLARRYSTIDLQGMATTSSELLWDDQRASKTSILQSLASELVVAASLDPAGNVRRGSSAALQELIGRHPNVVENGIAVVQVVDYHAVALRSRAIREVAPHAASLSKVYRLGLLTGLMGWRGAKDADVSARRNAAHAVGKIFLGDESDILAHNFVVIKGCMDVLAMREVENRHGIVLALAEVLSVSLSAEGSNISMEAKNRHAETILLEAILNVLKSFEQFPPSRLPELFSEAASKFMLACRPDEILLKSKQMSSTFTKLMPRFLREDHPSSIEPVSAAATLLLYLPEAAQNSIADVVKKLSSQEVAGKSATAIHALFNLLNIPTKNDIFPQHDVLQIIIKRWNARSLPDLQIREVILDCIATCNLSRNEKAPFIPLVAEGLNDYTTTTRGDIGSKVRIAAAKAAGSFVAIPTPDQLHTNLIDGEKELLALVVRTSGEKLDKVRAEGQRALICALMRLPGNSLAAEAEIQHEQEAESYSSLQNLTCSSQDWFYFLLSIQHAPWWKANAQAAKNDWSLELMSGYVTSAGAGSEDVVRASRAALVDFCLAASGNANHVCTTLIKLLQQKIDSGDERVLVPTLEVLAFLMDLRILQTSNIDFKALHTLTRRTQLNSKNIRKLEACIRLYGGLMESVYPPASLSLKKMLVHRYPSVRNSAVDELWIRLDGKEGQGEGEREGERGGGRARLRNFDWVRGEKEHLAVRAEEVFN